VRVRQAIRRCDARRQTAPRRDAADRTSACGPCPLPCREWCGSKAMLPDFKTLRLRNQGPRNRETGSETGVRETGSESDVWPADRCVRRAADADAVSHRSQSLRHGRRDHAENAIM